MAVLAVVAAGMATGSVPTVLADHREDQNDVSAERCETWWYWRNRIAARAGHCFVTPLGRGVFGGACDPGATVPVEEAARMEGMLVEERRRRCAVDASRDALHHADREEIDRVERAPVPLGHDGEQWGCIDFQRGPLSLHAAPSADSPVLGTFENGMDAGLDNHRTEGEWEWVDADLPDGREIAGWAICFSKFCNVAMRRPPGWQWSIPHGSSAFRAAR